MALPPYSLVLLGFFRRLRPGFPVAATRGVSARMESFGAGPSSAPLAPAARTTPPAVATAYPPVRGALGEAQQEAEPGETWLWALERERGLEHRHGWAWFPFGS